jgi:curved DNA-binding protein
MEYKDYYKVLGVERNADAQEIKKAYRKLAMQHHPDRNQGNKKSEEKFKDINEAYQVLSDPGKRSRYDQLGDSYFNWQQGGGGPGGFNWQDWYQQPRGGARVDVDNIEDLFGGGFSDFFNSIFGGMGGTSTGRRTRQPGQPSQMQPVTISLQEAFQGAVRTLEVNGRRFEVKIPAGAKTGTKVRIPGAAMDDGRGNRSDIYLLITISPDNRFELKGNDLHTEVTIDMISAVLGGQAAVPTLSGEVKLTIPAGTQPGQAFRLSGRGMPHLKDPKTFGDLYVKVKVRIPRQINDHQRALFEQLRGL